MAIDDNASYELTGYQVKDLAQKIRAKADSASLASVATSGLYSDLTGAPTIPTVYNGTLTIQQNGTTLGTFSANQDTNETVNITSGGGASVTTFHWGGSPNYSMYKDSGYTTPATYSDIATAYADGLVYIADGEDETTYVMVSDIPDANTITVTGIGLPGNDGGSNSYAYASSTWTKTATQFQTKLSAGTNIQINGTTISATDTTYSNFVGATSSVAGTAGLVPAPAAGDEGKALHGDGTWKDTTAKLVEMSYGESNAWAKFIAAYNAGSIVYCRASSNANPGTGSQTRKAFMAYVNNATSPTSVEFQYVRSQSSKTDSQQTDQVFVYTLTNTSGGTWSVASRNMGPKIVAGTGMTSTFTAGANATITLNASAMTGATSGAAGTAGIVPAPAAGDQDKFLKGDGTWAVAGGGGGRTTLYTDHSINVYSVGDTITLYKDKALTQPITTLAELGGLFDSSVVVIEDNSKESWLFFCWYDDDAYNWSGPGYFWVRSWGGEELVLCWDRYDGNVLKLHSVNTYQQVRSYSTSEAYTGENWIDGKGIYRKTINFGALPNSTTKSVAHNITGLSEVVKIEGIAKSSSNNYSSVPVVPGNANALCDCSVNATDVSMTAGSDRSGWSAYVTIYYTKS